MGEDEFINYWRTIDLDDTESAEQREIAQMSFIAGMCAAIDCWEQIEEWQERGETLLESRPPEFIFSLGEWWADRPWRQRDNCRQK